jgi:carbon monoxide dehydrogenase subunit G
MKRFEHRRAIPADPMLIWDLTSDIERWPSLFPTVTEVHRMDAGPLGVGSAARIKQPGQPHRVWTVTEFDAPRRFAWETSGRGFRMHATHDINAAPDGTTVNCLIIEIAGPLSGLLAALAGRRIKATLATENEGFCRASTTT